MPNQQTMVRQIQVLMTLPPAFDNPGTNSYPCYCRIRRDKRTKEQRRCQSDKGWIFSDLLCMLFRLRVHFMGLVKKTLNLQADISPPQFFLIQKIQDLKSLSPRSGLRPAGLGDRSGQSPDNISRRRLGIVRGLTKNFIPGLNP
jgi:hypothetical protein